ncbi:unnamed protein product [Callosobruchus maculatus]|uniref:Uncharacterized protein n=1 Tax=Callosobruchus maculatus TaxID=64391 RepID=A0A653DL57_CALMS|nr:unnamed protein product [Callosobruchus maculatus]
MRFFIAHLWSFSHIKGLKVRKAPGEGQITNKVLKLLSSKALNAGVPQGSVLLPTLFVLYINELLEIISNPIYSFADNSTLISCMEPGKPLSSQGTVRCCQQHVSQINVDIKTIIERGLVNKVQFNVQKTQATTLAKKSHIGLPTVEMEGHPIVESLSVKLLRININNNMSWHDHVVSIAKTASQKLGVWFRCRKLYTPELLYKAQIRPSLKYCSHHSLKLPDTIQKRAIRLIDTPNLTKDLHGLEHRRRVADLSLFYRLKDEVPLCAMWQIVHNEVQSAETPEGGVWKGQN